MSYDPGAAALGEAIGSLISDARNRREAQRIQAIIDELDDDLQASRNNAERASRDATRWAAQVGAYYNALQQADPHHPALTEDAWKALRKLGENYPPETYGGNCQEAVNAGAKYLSELRRSPDAPSAATLLAQKDAEIRQLREMLAEAQRVARVHKSDAEDWKESAQFRKKQEWIWLDTPAGRVLIDLVHHRAQRAVFRSELARLAPEHPLVKDAQLRESISKAAEANMVWAGVSFTEDGQSVAVFELKDHIWSKLDEAALEEFRVRCGNALLQQEMRQRAGGGAASEACEGD
jgi:hypothetical protein